MSRQEAGLSAQELAAEGVTGLPDKEVVSLLDLNADLDLDLDVAAPIDLAIAANANVAAPIDAAVAANVLSSGSTAQALADQGVMITQDINADAVANSNQDSTINQESPAATGTETGADTTESTDGAAPGTTSPDTSAPAGDATLPDVQDGVDQATGALDGDLLNVDVNLAADADIAAPVNGAVAANANVAAPIDAAVAANIGSVDSEATAVADQDAIINQSIEGSAEANADQKSDIEQ